MPKLYQAQRQPRHTGSDSKRIRLRSPLRLQLSRQLPPNATPTEIAGPTPDATPAADLTTPTPSDAPVTTQSPDSNPTVQGPPASDQPSATPSVTPTATPITPVEQGQVTTTVVNNIDLSTITGLATNVVGTPTITTDKTDYSPTSIVLITGTGFIADKTYTLEIVSTDQPPVDFKTDIKMDSNGGFTYAYQLDGNYRPNYTVNVFDGTILVASTTFTDTDKITICHANDSQSNPYVTNQPDKTADAGGHDGHNGVVWYPGIADHAWGDIIPPFTYPGGSYPGKNWTAEGQAVYNNSCHVPSDLKVQKTNNLTSSTGDVGQTFTWKVRIDNVGLANAYFHENETILSDNLPNTNVVYGTPTFTYNDVDHPGDMTCSISSYALSCTVKNNKDVTIRDGGYIEISFTATFSLGGTYTNPRSGGICRVDPSDTINELSETNNDCSDTVTIRTTTGTLIIVKHVNNDDGGTLGASSFTLHVKGSGTDVSGSPTAGSETGTSYTLAGGTYVVSENTPPTGYTQTGFSGDCDSNGNATVVAGQSKTCTITNDDVAPTLKLVKTVLGGSSTAHDWTLSAQSNGAGGFSDWGDSTDFHNVDANISYALSELGPSGYTPSDWSCDNGVTVTDSAITIPLAKNVTCSITNTRDTGTVTVQKQLDPTNDPGLFNLLIDGEVKASDVGNGGSTGAITVETGNHTVSETEGTGTSLSDYNSSIDCGRSGSGQGTTLEGITVNKDQNIVCVISNSVKRGTIIVEKQTNPGGAQGDFTFTGDVAGTVSAGEQIEINNLVPGQYTSTEENPSPAFDLTDITCDDGNSTGDIKTRTATFNLEAGEIVKCTFTNTQRATVNITKYLDSNADGSQNNGEPGLSGWDIILGDTTQTTEGIDGTTTFANVVPGEYPLTEDMTGHDGYIQSNISCFNGLEPVGYDEDGYKVNVTAGSTINCFIGNYQNAQITVTKEVTDPSGEPIAKGSDDTSFDFSSEALDDSFSLANGESTEVYSVKPGSYDISEDTSNENYEFKGCTNLNSDGFVTVTSGQDINVVCTNQQKRGTITGYKWNDENNNHERDQSFIEDSIVPLFTEPTIAGWTIYLEDAEGNILQTTQTDAQGNYQFTVDPGTYKICEGNQDGWQQTYPYGDGGSCYDIQIGSNGSSTGNNFGNYLIPIPKLSVDKTPDSQNASAGQTVTFSLKVTNNGNTTVNNVDLTDVLPGGFSYVAGSTTGDFTNDPSISGGTLTWNTGLSLAPKESLTISYKTTIASDEADGTYTNFADCNANYGERLSVSCDPKDSATVKIGHDVNFGGTLGQVLGISTELPATGSPTGLFIFAIGALGLGLFLRIYNSGKKGKTLLRQGYGRARHAKN